MKPSMPLSFAPLSFATVAALAFATPALADDRAPTPTEAQAITAILHAAGFKSWDEIEFDTDDNRWEVDDARDVQGQQWDLHLAPGTYEIVRRERG